MGTTIGVMGVGNMGAALVRGWSHASDAELSLLIYDVAQERMEALLGLDGVEAASSPEELAKQADVILLVVKPKEMGRVIERLRAYLTAGKAVVSCAAGVTLDTVRAGLGDGPSVYRIMPNLGVELGQGVIAVATEALGDSAMDRQVVQLFEPLGLVKVLPEDMFDAVTAVSGSSPAFLALVLEGMEDGAVRAGMDRPTARAFLRQTAVAACLLLQKETGSAADLKDQVSSPGGTTMAGLAVLEDRGVRGAFLRAIEASSERSRVLRDAGLPRTLD